MQKQTLGRHFFKIKVQMNHFFEDYTDPQLTVIRIGDIQSRRLYTPPYWPSHTLYEQHIKELSAPYILLSLQRQ